MSTNYRRIVFVGLGGSGGKTLRFLKRDINRWFDEIGWTKGMPKGWQFLQIDTPTYQDGVEIPIPMLPDTEYLGLIGPGIQFDQIDEELLSVKDNRSEFATWRVNPNALHIPVHAGAGQFRAVGRTIAVGYLKKIRQRLAQTFSNLNQADAQSSLAELFRFVHDGEQPTANTAAPIVVVVSSLAGGTGAGLINDVCDLIRELEPVDGDAIFGLLFTPEVFASDVPEGGGIQPNSLAAVSEILNGYWWNGNSGSGIDKIPMKNSAPMKAASAVTPIKRTGPAFPFLVGAKNSSGISYKSSRQLFEVVGGALTSWATDINVQSELLSYTFANWAAHAGEALVKHHNVLVNQGDQNNNEPGINPFNAFGFARVSVGNRYFGAYSAERIARDAVEFVRDNYQDGSVAISLRQGQPNITSQELIDRQCEMQFTSFLNRCLLNEKGPTSNQVQDALKPQQGEWEAIFYESVSLAGQFVTMEGNHSAKEWMDEIKPAIENAAIHFDTRCQPVIDTNILKWIENQPQVVINSVSEAIGELGLHITEALVKRLIQEITDPTEGIISDLREEINQFTMWINPKSWSDKAEGAFSNPTRKVPRGDVVELAINEGLADAICTTWIRVKNSSIEILNTFVNGFLEPLRLSLSSAIYEIENNSAVSSSWPSWPSDGEIPTLSPNSTPPQSEYTIIKTDEFAGLFDQLLATTVGGSVVMREMHRQTVRTDVVVSSFVNSLITENPVLANKYSDLRLINVTNSWWPGMSVVANSHIGPKMATFKINLAESDVAERARLWLNQTGNAFKSVLEDDLASFTKPKNAQIGAGLEPMYAERGAAFISAFNSAISASKPLVNLDSQLMSVLLGPGHPKISVEMSALPFRGHPLENEVRGLLVSLFEELPKDKSPEPYIKPSGIKAKHIDIVSSLYGAYPVLVIQSILQPIAESWNVARGAKVSRGEFWNKRRGRRLQEFIPAPQEHIRCMVRGWFAGLVMGLVSDEPDGWKVVTRMADQPSAPQSLPQILLSDSAETGDNIARILESLGLAFVEVGIHNNLLPLGGYVNLLDLGRSGDGTGKGLNSYGTIGDYLEHWVRTGTLPEARNQEQRTLIPLAGVDVFGITDESSPEERKRALSESFNDYKETYATRYGEFLVELDLSVNVLSSPPLWISMYDMIDTSLDQLINAVEKINLGADKAQAMNLNDGRTRRNS